MCLRNISKYFTTGYLKKTGLKGYVDDISVDYNIIEKTKIINIHEYLIKKNDIEKCLDLLKNVCSIIN